MLKHSERLQPATIADFASFLQRYVLDRPVIDQTQLQGKYDFSLHWTPDDSIRGPGLDLPEEAADQPGLFTAIQE